MYHYSLDWIVTVADGSCHDKSESLSQTGTGPHLLRYVTYVKPAFPEVNTVFIVRAGDTNKYLSLRAVAAQAGAQPPIKTHRGMMPFALSPQG